MVAERTKIAAGGELSYAISIIVPVLNEEANLPDLLDSVLHFPQTEIIFVDGGSTDRSAEIINNFTSLNHVRFIQSKKSRSMQMNAGAEIASGKYLLFLHADTKISLAGIKHILSFAEAKKNKVGCFRFRVNSSLYRFRLLEFLVEMRNYILDIPFGDQAFFVSRNLWDHVGKYAEIPLMEDVEWIKRVTQMYDLTILPYSAVTDGRRWLKNGFIKNSMLNIYLQLRFFRGDNPADLNRLYYS